MNKRGLADRIRSPRLISGSVPRIPCASNPRRCSGCSFFPLLLAAGLGIAFRNTPPQVLKIAVVSPKLADSLRAEKLLDIHQLTESESEESLRTGKIALLVEPGPDGSVVYRYDNTNPEGRAARMLADAALQRAAGRLDPVWLRTTG